MAVETALLDPAIHQRLQRKTQRQKEALARLEKTLLKTKRRLREKENDAEFAALAIAEALRAWGQGRESEAVLVLETWRGESRFGYCLAAARKRDQALLTLRAKVSALHRALTTAKAMLQTWHVMDAETWVRYQDSPEMQEINRALGERP